MNGKWVLVMGAILFSAKAFAALVVGVTDQHLDADHNVVENCNVEPARYRTPRAPKRGDPDHLRDDFEFRRLSGVLRAVPSRGNVARAKGNAAYAHARMTKFFLSLTDLCK